MLRNCEYPKITSLDLRTWGILVHHMRISLLAQLNYYACALNIFC